MNVYEYDGIEYHADTPYGERHAAINVKLYSFPNLSEDAEPFADSAFESVREAFWEEATERAHDAGYSGVFAEGRNGGWMVPYYQTLPRDERERRNLRTHPKTFATLMLTWPGQGGFLGYPRYPDMDCIGERSRFRGFQRQILRMLEDVPRRIVEQANMFAEDAGEGDAGEGDAE